MSNLTPLDDHWFSEIKEPLRPQSEKELQWDEVTDVLIVGCGGAGIASALEASDHQKNVLVIDRFFGGGATAASGGIYYAGGGTSIQKEAKVKDSVEEMYKYCGWAEKITYKKTEDEKSRWYKFRFKFK